MPEDRSFKLGSLSHFLWILLLALVERVDPKDHHVFIDDTTRGLHFVLYKLVNTYAEHFPVLGKIHFVTDPFEGSAEIHNAQWVMLSSHIIYYVNGVTHIKWGQDSADFLRYEREELGLNSGLTGAAFDELVRELEAIVVPSPITGRLPANLQQVVPASPSL